MFVLDFSKSPFSRLKKDLTDNGQENRDISRAETILEEDGLHASCMPNSFKRVLLIGGYYRGNHGVY